MRNFPVSLESRRSENSRNRVVRISVGVGQDAEGTLRNTRGSTVERLERKPCDLSLIGGARPADWLTRKTLSPTKEEEEEEKEEDGYEDEDEFENEEDTGSPGNRSRIEPSTVY
uniref:Uncharacterized protein n=1 Tax=Vespula pensylvanica TaxID=30213 RepID=A0A834PAE8_VESPE|nr:hypothetical protein H0235_002591 [Vespula pensylvanica]